MELQLQQACRYVWSLTWKDYFTCTERRYIAYKECRLPNGELLRGFRVFQHEFRTLFCVEIKGFK